MKKKIFLNVARPSGFTLIELLVVIAIIGFLATLAVTSLNNARSKSRDARRVSDIHQIQTALDLYFSSNNAYPTAITSGSAIASGGVTYMASVPSNPQPADSGCGGAIYTYATQSSNSSYTLQFCLAGVTGGIPAGAHTAAPFIRH